MTDRLVFHRDAPHPLLRAQHASYTGAAETNRTTIGDGVATVAGRSGTYQSDARYELHLADYLAVERWLADDRPAVGETQAARSFDFDRLVVVADRWRVLDRDQNAVTVGKDAENGSTFVRMDGDLVPTRMQIGPLFALQAVDDEAIARLWEHEPRIFDDAVHVPVDRRIERPADLRRLVLAVHHERGEEPPWLATLPAELVADSDASAHRRLDAQDAAVNTAATVRYPADDPWIRGLAGRAVAGLADDAERLQALTRFVHNRIRYRSDRAPQGVLATLRIREGDCTEFADALTTLARAIGLPARTVVGLAYRAAPGAAGAFALHAWNEVALKGLWQSVDPTWGQTPADLTHFALPDDSALTFIAERSALRFEVVDAAY